MSAGPEFSIDDAMGAIQLIVGEDTAVLLSDEGAGRVYSVLEQLSQPVQAVKAEPVAWRMRYRSEPGMLGHYPWTYTERIRGIRLGQYEYEPLYAAGEKT